MLLAIYPILMNWKLFKRGVELEISNWELSILEPEKINLSSDEKLTREVETPSCLEMFYSDKTYTGKVLYETRFIIDEKKQNMSYSIFFERVSYVCNVSINGQVIGSHEGTWDSFLFDITDYVNEGINSLEVIVNKAVYEKDNPYYFRSTLQGFIPDVSSTFCGIFGKVEIIENHGIFLSNLSSSVDLQKNIGAITVCIDSLRKLEFEEFTMELTVLDPNNQITVYNEGLVQNETKFSLDTTFLSLWSPESPRLYEITVNLFLKNQLMATKSQKIGFRHVKVKNGKIFLNNNPIFPRGILHWGYYPELIAPIPKKEKIIEEIMGIKEQGFNMIKHCLYFPTQEYYELCDEMGILQWQEMPLWLPTGDDLEKVRVSKQYPKMLNQFIEHTSIIITTIGCELNDIISGDELRSLYYLVKNRKDDMIVCDNSGSAEAFGGPAEVYSDLYDYHFYGELNNMESLINQFTPTYRDKKPWFMGEFCDADTFRNMELFKNEWWASDEDYLNPLKITHRGFAEVPIIKQAATLKNELVSHNELQAATNASYQKAYFMRKQNLELLRKFDEITGYNITTLSDVAITTSGIFDDNGSKKFSDRLMKSINGDCMLLAIPKLARKWENGADKVKNMDMYNFKSGDILDWNLYFSNRSVQNLSELKLNIKLQDQFGDITNENDIFIEKSFVKDSLSILNSLYLKLPVVDKSIKLTLFVTLYDNDGQCITENQWSIFVHPLIEKIMVNKLIGINVSSQIIEESDKSSCIIVSELTDEILDLVKSGYRVIWCPLKSSNYLKSGPFWREGIQIFSDVDKFIDDIACSRFADAEWLSVSSEQYFQRKEIAKLFPNYHPLISRLDARTFEMGEYLFYSEVGLGSVIGTTLNLFSGVGTQPELFDEDIFGQKLLYEMINYKNNRGNE